MIQYRCLLYGVCLLVWQVGHAQSADAGAVSTSIPSRPVGHILDEARWFTLEEREAAQRELNQLFSENDIDIYLVTQENVPSQGASGFARSLGEAWSRSPVWCVVLQIPGDPEGFHVEAGGVKMSEDIIAQTLKEATRRAKRESTEKERFIAAWRECSEGLRFIHGARVLAYERRAEAQKQNIAEQRRKQLLKKIFIAAGVIVLLVFLVVLVMVVRRFRSRRLVYLFPETLWRIRYQAPHSGGGGIVVNYLGDKSIR